MEHGSSIRATRAPELQRERGYTLIELLAVIAILGILIAVALPRYSTYVNDSHDSKARVSLDTAYRASDAFNTSEQVTDAASLRTLLAQSEPELNFTVGTVTDVGGPNDVVVDSASDSNVVILHVRSDTGHVYTLTAPRTGHVSIGRYATEILADNPAAYWRMDESAGKLLDYGPNHYDANPINGPARSTSGSTSADNAAWSNAFGGAASQQGFDAPQSPSPTNAVTIEAWVKRTANFTTDDPYIVGRVNTPNVTGYYMYVLHNTHRVVFGTADGTSHRWVTSTGSLPLNQWTYLVGTREANGTNRIYFNGVLENTSITSATPIQNSTIDLFLGRYATTNAGYIDAQVDEVAIYNYALPDTRVTAHWAAATQNRY